MHNEMEKCWICGKQASKTITKEQLFFEDSFGEYITDHQLISKGTHRAYCEECFKNETEKLAERKRQYAILKKQLMLERAIRSLERQDVPIYHYRDLLHDFESLVEEEPEKFDSSEEMLAMLILADHGIKVKPQFKVGKYKIDFLIPELKVALEVDGDRHAGKLYEDNRRDQLIRAVLGEDWEVVRISTDYIDANAEKLVDAIKAVREKKQSIRKEYGGVLPEWYSKRERAHRPKQPPKIGDDELLNI